MKRPPAKTTPCDPLFAPSPITGGQRELPLAVPPREPLSPGLQNLTRLRRLLAAQCQTHRRPR